MATTSNPMRVQLGVLKAAALLMSLSFCVGVQAATADGASRSDQGMGANEQHMMPGGRKVEELHKQLALTDAQEALWKQARDTSEKLHQEMRQSMQARHEKMRQALQGKNPDLRALADQMDKDREADQQKHKQVQEAWLKFYDALNPEQKQKASQFLLGMMNRMSEGHRGRPMGGMSHGDDDHPDMPPRR